MIRSGLSLLAVLICSRAFGATWVVTNNADTGEGSLRWAWVSASTNPGCDTIEFHIPPGGHQFIQLESSLPISTESMIIDGWTQPGFTQQPLVEIRGTFPSAVSLIQGLRFEGQTNLVRGLILNRFASPAIKFTSSSNTLTGCWLGLDDSGTPLAASGASGVEITSDGNRIGGSQPLERNVIAGHLYSGIHIISGSRNVIQGNYIGTDASGSFATGNGFAVGGIGNDAAGIFIESFAAGNRIGGDGPGEGNLIAGNIRGIALRSGAFSNSIFGNVIGPDISGTTNCPGTRQLTGIEIIGAFNTVIGGTNPAMRNLISGNGVPGNVDWGNGISLSGATGTVIRGNAIGTDRTGTRAIPNLCDGIYLTDSANGNLIGGTASGAGNLISGNQLRGIRIWQSHRNIIQGNIIGAQSNRTDALGNGSGIFIYAGTGNMLGGTIAGAGNIIAWNAYSPTEGDGVFISGVDQGALTTNTMRRNSIFDNAGYGIRLFNISCLGCAPFNDNTDSDTGPNQLQNFPVLTRAVTSEGSLNITGTLHSAILASFILEFYASPTLDASGFGEGRTYLGTVVVSTDGSGNAGFDTFLSDPGVSGQFITAVAIDAAGNSSEFSAAVLADNEAGGFAFASASSQIDERFGPAIIGVKRLAGSTGAASITFSVTGGTATASSDFTPTNGVLQFANGETYKTISVSVVNDTSTEIAETIHLSLQDPSVGTILLQPAHHILNVLDDDILRVTARDGAATKAATGTVQLILPVVLSGLAEGPVTAKVSYATADLTAVAGIDYLSQTGLLAFANGLTQQTVQITVLADGLQEGPKAFQLILSNPSNAVLDDATAIGNIYDGTQGTLAFTADALAINEDAGSFTATVRRTGGALGIVSVPFTAYPERANAPLDYGSTNGTLSFGNGVTSRFIVVEIRDDPEIEGDEGFLLELGTPSGTTLQDPSVLRVRILDNEPLPSLSIQSATNAVRLGWETNAPVFQLYGSTSLLSAVWIPLTNTVFTNNSRIELFDPAAEQRHYRLIR